MEWVGAIGLLTSDEDEGLESWGIGGGHVGMKLRDEEGVSELLDKRAWRKQREKEPRNLLCSDLGEEMEVNE